MPGVSSLEVLHIGNVIAKLADSMDWLFGVLKAQNPHQSQLRILELEVFAQDDSAQIFLERLDSIMGVGFPSLERVTIEGNGGDWEGARSFTGTVSAKFLTSLPLMAARGVLKVYDDG